MTQRLRKEDDPLKRCEIEVEFVLKACDLGLTSKAETEPIKDSEQNANNKQGTVAIDGGNNYQGVKAGETEKTKAAYLRKFSAERHGKERTAGPQAKPSKTSESEVAYENSQSAGRLIKREDADDI